MPLSVASDQGLFYFSGEHSSMKKKKKTATQKPLKPEIDIPVVEMDKSNAQNMVKRTN